ncbi:MAG: glycosyltransferase family 39 protein, partial [Asticcacaulis sp.]
MAANRSAGAGIDIRRDYIAWGLAMAALCLHAAFAGRYDVFRDELYFIVCGRHPDFGYADQPPIIPLLAAGFYAPGHSTWLLRLPAVLAAGALPWLSVRFARLLGGGTVAAVGAGLAVTIAPMLMGITATLNTTVFDPLAWTLIAWLLVHAVKSGDERALLLCGLVAGLDLEVKYAGVFWLVSLFIGLLATPERKLFTRKHLWIGGVVCALLAAPSLIWQAVHGFPFLELAAASRGKNTDTPPIAFMLNQVLVMNPLLAPLWVCGVIAPFVMESLRSVRFLSIAFVTCLLLVIVTHGKDYYLAAAYPVMFTVGATAIGQGVRDVWSRTAAIGWAAAAFAFSAWVAPFALPILPVAALKVYVEHFPLKPQQQEKSFKGTLLPQVFADQLGWRDFAREVG